MKGLYFGGGDVVNLVAPWKVPDSDIGFDPSFLDRWLDREKYVWGVLLWRPG